MEYDTFQQSHDHSRRSLEHLINLIRTRVDATPAFTVFLGAGASVTSGVRTARSMMEDWRRTRYSATSVSLSYEDWLKQQDWFGEEDEYSQLFELVYDQPSQRRAYIEKEVSGARPSWGYAYLASLVEQGIFNAIFTTNFDDLANESCFQFASELRPLVCAHDSAVTSIRLISQRPKIIKLHGDFLYDSIKNTSSEVSNLEANMRDKFIEFAREFGMIVMGYSGSDKSVMDVFSVLARSPSYFRNGIYWCLRKGDVPGTRLRQLLRQDRVFWLEIDGFDDAMASIADGIGVTLPSGLLAPHETTMHRLSHLLHSSDECSHPRIAQHRNAIAEERHRVEELMKGAGLYKDFPEPRSVRRGRRDALGKMVGDMESFVMPTLQGGAAMDQKDYARAGVIFRGMLGTVSGWHRWGVVHRLLECLIDSGAERNEIIDLMNGEIGNPGGSDEFAGCAYFALFVNEPDLALQYCSRALALNPGSPLALVNKAFAHLQKNEESEVMRLTETLIAARMQYRHRAAGHALRGEFKQLTIALHQAFAAHDYSPDSAARDVVFRAYWDIPEFVAVLKPFHSKLVEFPRKDLYPISDAEKRLRARFVQGSSSP